MTNPLPAASHSLSFVWFTWGPDGDCLTQSIRSIRRIAPAAWLTVFYDPDSPLPSDQIWELNMSGVSVRPSAGPHGANLNGPEHLARQLAALEAAAPPSGFVVKIDSDTIVQNLDWLALGMSADRTAAAVGFATTHPPQPWCGPCYALRADVLRTLRIALAAAPESLVFPKNYPEDESVWTLLHYQCPDQILRLPTWPATQFFAGFQYPFAPVTVLDLAAYFALSVVTFGNRNMLPASLSDREKRQQAAAAMQLFLDA